jgi:hypothetical protein
MLVFTSENSKQIITIVETWFDDPCLNYKPITNLNDYLKIEYALVENIYDLIEKVEFFEHLQVDSDGD